jgi:hypothetical protein
MSLASGVYLLVHYTHAHLHLLVPPLFSSHFLVHWSLLASALLGRIVACMLGPSWQPAMQRCTEPYSATGTRCPVRLGHGQQ